MGLKSYWAWVKAADKTDTKEDLPKTKNLVYILVIMLIDKQSYVTRLC